MYGRYAPINLLTLKCGMGNVEWGMMGILPCKIRLYSIDDTDREVVILQSKIISN